MRTIFLLGRSIFGGFFVYNGVNHFRNRAQMSAYAGMKGTPAPAAAVLGTGGMLVAGGASVIAGVRPKQGLAAIVAFLVPVSLQMHRYWEIDDPAQRQNETINFMKNMALAGAALALTAVPEPWAASLARDHRPRRSIESSSYPTFTPRDLKRLPA